MTISFYRSKTKDKWSEGTLCDAGVTAKEDGVRQISLEPLFRPRVAVTADSRVLWIRVEGQGDDSTAQLVAAVNAAWRVAPESRERTLLPWYSATGVEFALVYDDQATAARAGNAAREAIR